jgi:hypothetical protein
MEVLLPRLAAIFAGGQRTVRKLMRFIMLLLLLGAKIMAHQVCAPITIHIITVHSLLTQRATTLKQCVICQNKVW